MVELSENFSLHKKANFQIHQFFLIFISYIKEKGREEIPRLFPRNGLFSKFITSFAAFCEYVWSMSESRRTERLSKYNKFVVCKHAVVEYLPFFIATIRRV